MKVRDRGGARRQTTAELADWRIYFVDIKVKKPKDLLCLKFIMVNKGN